MPAKTLEAWLEHLEHAHSKPIDLSLERAAEVAARLRLRSAGKTLTVAGTNGKGSTVATVNALLRAQGVAVGVFTSPHIVSFNERIVINDELASDAAIVDAFEAIEQARGEISLTYYEFSALAAAFIFQQAQVDVWILEVGLGGRLDAVNIFDADVAVVTSIDLDHQDYLGDTRELIAIEKAGVARAGAPCVVAESNLPRTLLPELNRIGAVTVRVDTDYELRFDPFRWSGKWQSSEGHINLTNLPRSALLPSNLAAGVQALLCLGYGLPGNASAVLTSLQVPGRREIRDLQNRTVLVDVAHNPAAIKALAEFVEARFAPKTCRAVFSAMIDKDTGTMFALAADTISHWYLPNQAHNTRVAKALELKAVLENVAGQGAKCYDTVAHACEAMWQESQQDDLLLIIGSFTTVAAFEVWARQTEN
ncbi:bifunctional folylpolyglutamate synthase/dihydrofolate synthase [Aequoribacter sp.]|uniref:bifunctional folylpolyglutamate synthase/dihydrofolate synthase n=1 Tax=Aequoribacter sp. TaxID=2847771 RepID=UPI003C5B7910